MDKQVQTILIPVVNDVPYAAISFAQLLSRAYGKPVSFLCFTPTLVEELEKYDCHVTLSSGSFVKTIQDVILKQDAVMVVFEPGKSRRLAQKQLLACRDLRIPYFFIPKEASVEIPSKVVLPMSFLIEDREKGTWGRSLNRYFKSELILINPKDKGTRASKNVAYVETFFDKFAVPYTTISGNKSSFKNDKEALDNFSDSGNMILLTASREYGLDDALLGPRELHIIRQSNIPIMMINPRDDLYILCGD